MPVLAAAHSTRWRVFPVLLYGVKIVDLAGTLLEKCPECSGLRFQRGRSASSLQFMVDDGVFQALLLQMQTTKYIGEATPKMVNRGERLVFSDDSRIMQMIFWLLMTARWYSKRIPRLPYHLINKVRRALGFGVSK